MSKAGKQPSSASSKAPSNTSKSTSNIPIKSANVHLKASQSMTSKSGAPNKSNIAMVNQKKIKFEGEPGAEAPKPPPKKALVKKPVYEAPRPTNLRKWIPPDERPKPPKPPVYEAPKPVITHRWIPPDRRKKPTPPPKYEPPPLPPAKKHWVPPDMRKKRPPKPPAFSPPKPFGKTIPAKISTVDKAWNHFVFLRGLNNPSYLLAGFSQESKRFKKDAGLQGIANCIVACSVIQIIKPMSKWDVTILNQILLTGQRYYEESMKRRECRYEDMSMEKFLPFFFLCRIKVLIEVQLHLQQVFDLDNCGKDESLADIIFGYIKGDTRSGMFEIAGKFFCIFKSADTAEEKMWFFFDPTDHTRDGQPLNIRPRGSGYAIVVMTTRKKQFIEELIKNLPPFKKTEVKITPIIVAKYGNITEFPPDEFDDLTNKIVPESKECRRPEDEKEPTPPPELVPEEERKKTQAILEVNPEAAVEEAAVEITEKPSFLAGVDLAKEMEKHENEKLKQSDVLALQPVKPKPVSRYVDVIPNRIQILRARTHQCDTKHSKYAGKQSLGNMISCFTMLRFYKAKRWITRLLMDILDYGERYYNAARLAKPEGFQFRLSHFPKTYEMNKVYFYLEAEESMAFGQLNSEEYEILDLSPCLQNFFINHSCGIVHGPLVVAVWVEDGKFYMFDPNERNDKGEVILDPESEPPGFACVTVFVDLADLCELYTNNLTSADQRDFFSISAVKVLDDPNIPLKWFNFEGFKKNRWIVRADFCQDDSRFESPGRNVQCTAMAAMSIMYSVLNNNFTLWTKETLNEIVLNGDKYYRESMEFIKKTKPDFPHEMLCADELLKRKVFKDFERDVRLNVTCPIFGMLRMSEQIEGIYDFRNGLKKFFENYTHGICTSGSISTGFWKISPKEYYYFDSHSRNNQGLTAPGGRACLIRTNNPEDLSMIIMSNIPSIKGGEFNIYELGMKVIKIVQDVPRPDKNYYKPVSDEDGDYIVIVRGQFCNSSDKFEVNSGKQSFPMCFIAMGYNVVKSASKWSSTDVDIILDRGDAFYIESYLEREDKEVEEIDMNNIKKEFTVGYNKFTVESHVLYEGFMDEMFIECLATTYKEPLTEDDPRMELIFQSPINVLLIFRDENGYYLFDSYARDKCGKYFGGFLDQEDDVEVMYPTDDEGAGDMSSPEETVAVTEGDQGAGDNPLGITSELVDEEEDDGVFTLQKFFRQQNDRQWNLFDPTKRKYPKKQALLDFAKIHGRAFCMRFLLLQDLVMHIFKSYMPSTRGVLECKLHKIFLTTELFVVDKYRPLTGEKIQSFYDGDWHEFKEVEKGVWILNSTVTLDEDIFPAANRGHQEVPVCMSILQYCYMYSSLARYSSKTLDKVISYGDKLYSRIKRDQFQNLKANTSLRDEEIDTIVKSSSVTFDNLYKKIKLTTHSLNCQIDSFVSGHLYAKEKEDDGQPEDIGEKEINLQQALELFFEGNNFGFIKCNGLLVAIYKGAHVFYMFDPNRRGPDGKYDGTGTPCLTRFLALDKLKDTFMANIDIYGNNFFDIYTVELKEFGDDKEAEELRDPAMPEKPGESVIPGHILLGGWKKISGGKSILRGCLDNPLFEKVKCPAFVFVALAMSVIHKTTTWTYPILEEIAEVADLLFKLSRKEDDVEFNLETNPLFLGNVKDTFLVGAIKCHIVLRCPGIEGEYNPRNLKVKNLREALDDLFRTNTHGVIETADLMFPIWEETDAVTGKSLICIYDPIPRSPVGLPISYGGRACALYFSHDTFMVAEHIKQVLNEEDKHPKTFRLTATELVVGSKRIRKKRNLHQEQLDKCRKVRNKTDISKIMKLTEQEFQKKQEREIQRLGRYKYHCVHPGEIIRSYRSLSDARYAESARDNQDMVCSIIACVLFKLEHIDFWNCATLDLIIDTATQIYIDSFICYQPEDKKLGLKNVLRKFYVRDEYIKLSMYKPFSSIILSEQAICQYLEQYFMDERFNPPDADKFVLCESNNSWYAIFFAKKKYYLFDPHGTNHKGELDYCKGTAVLYRFQTVEDFADRFLKNYGEQQSSMSICHMLIETSKKEKEKTLCDVDQYK